jgi:hypothetical protein
LSILKQIKRGVLKERLNKIIGYYAILRGTPYILCDEDACVIGFKKEDLIKYITTLGTRPVEEYIIKKTTFGEVHKGMMMGGVYALDEEAYKVFLPLAKSKGMNLAEFKIEGDDQPPFPDAVRLMKIAWFPAHPEE